ncbi:MAG: hypothetical protein WCO19_03220 [Candidatus Saccharibacteria bacterium]
MIPLTQEQILSQSMVEAALPVLTTPPRRERLGDFDAACSSLANIAVESIFDMNTSRAIDHQLIVPMGIYATRSALRSLAKQDTVDHSTAIETSDELQDLCSFLKNKKQTYHCSGTSLGFFAELGMANMMWRGIAEGEIDLQYCVMTGTQGYERRHDGLRGDVDLVLRTARSGKNARKRVQIKASMKRQHEVYDDGIVVVTSQGVTNTRSPQEAVSQLINWKNQPETIKHATYDRLSSQLGLRWSERQRASA